MAARGVELAQVVRRLGGEAVVVEAADRLLAREAKPLGEALGEIFRREGIGLDTVGVEVNPRGVPVDARLQVAERLWAVGDVNGIWQLTHVGKYQGEVVASNILGEERVAAGEPAAAAARS